MSRHREPGNGIAFIGIGIALSIGLAVFIKLIDNDGIHGRYFDGALPWIRWLYVIPVVSFIWGAYLQRQRNKPLD